MELEIPEHARIVLPVEEDYPILPAPTKEQIRAMICPGGAFSEEGLARHNRLMQERNAAVERAIRNPYLYGWEPPLWKLVDALVGFITVDQFRADLSIPERWRKCARLLEFLAQKFIFILLMGGNRSGKTEYICKRQVRCGLTYPKADLWTFHENIDMSVDWHQRVVKRYLPPEWGSSMKDTKTGAYISYTVKNGFSDNRLVYPGEAIQTFKTYEQFEAKETSVEGSELGDPRKRPCIGYAADENMPLALKTTLKGRLATRDAVGIQAYTPIKGTDEVVGQTIEGATDILTIYADDVPAPKEGPLVQASGQEGEAVVYFPSRFNAFGNYKGLREQWKSATDREQKVRYYGWPFRQKMARFPRYVDKPLEQGAHLFALDGLPVEGTHYMIVDPAGSKNWFMGWVLVDPWDRRWVWREWPCKRYHIPGIGFPGPWAELGKEKGHDHGGVPGEGAKGFGFGLLDYKNEIARIEGWDDLKSSKRIEEWKDTNGAAVHIRGRTMDSRFANAPSYTSGENTTLLETAGDVNLFFEPTPGGQIDEGVDLINDALSFEEGWQKPEDGPKLFICEECENIRFALKTWTGEGGNKEATKDPIDILRYILTDPGICYREPVSRGRYRGGGYGSRAGGAGRSAATTKAEKLKRKGRK
ncbi:hypothetical protein [Ruficoccus sp. ZRK36]|uniref:hypothetical protein n=1 Tax=Ruficoccus sp. ZRK36 TaxID=2866311 RepID=UPI001C73ADE5|nr:hypothetical protein [Ruficoccus sp. ZRK36]QYY35304.1 hypothetical protein K0V07_13510 [Ruficoccus sp. ZRK36]